MNSSEMTSAMAREAELSRRAKWPVKDRLNEHFNKSLRDWFGKPSKSEDLRELEGAVLDFE